MAKNKAKTVVQSRKPELRLERVFDVPRELVFKAWTDPKLLTKWWGPKGVTTPVCEFDARVNGNINIVMLAGEELGSFKGMKWPMTGLVRGIKEPEKLVFSANAIMNDKPILEHLTTVTFDDYDGKTKMIVHIVVTKTTPQAKSALAGMEVGWTQSLDKLGQFLVN